MKLFLVIFLMFFTIESFSRGSGGHASSGGHSRSSYGKSYSSKSSVARSKSNYYIPKKSYSKKSSASKQSSTGILRDKKGRIKRSTSAKNAFKKTHPCPAGGAGGSCRGYVIDHIKPLKRGGVDSPSNMQWQTVREAKEKDKWE